MKHIKTFQQLSEAKVVEKETEHSLDEVKFKYETEGDKLKISAYLDNDEIGYCRYYKTTKDENFFLVDLINVKEKYRNNPNFKDLAIILMLLSHAKNNKIVSKAEDFTGKGDKFYRKLDSMGLWKFLKIRKQATLTEKGKELAEQYAKEYLNKNVKWN